MDPLDVPALAEAPPDAAARDDATALADLAAGRVIDNAAVVRWLGGWQIARDAPRLAGIAATPSRRSAASDAPEPVAWSVTWTEQALSECHRLRMRLATLAVTADTRLAAAIVAAVVTLTIEGADRPPGFADVALLPPLHLRIAVTRDGIVVLGLRWHGALS